LKELQEVRPGPEIDARTEMWLEEADEFGMMYMALGKTSPSKVEMTLTRCSECYGRISFSCKWLDIIVSGRTRSQLEIKNRILTRQRKFNHNFMKIIPT
jgi:Ribonuclease G/E